MKINLQTAKQNQKISFPFLFPLRGGGVGGGDARKMQGNFFGFCTRESASVSEAHWFASPGNRSVRFGSKPPRAPRVRISQNPADFSRNTFELRPIHTAKIKEHKHESLNQLSLGGNIIELCQNLKKYKFIQQEF